jgi:hypothetical protein
MQDDTNVGPKTFAACPAWPTTAITGFLRVAAYRDISDFVNLSSTAEAIQKLTDSLMTAETAEILGVSPNTLRACVKEWKFRMHRNPVNGYRLFQRMDA